MPNELPGWQRLGLHIPENKGGGFYPCEFHDKGYNFIKSAFEEFGETNQNHGTTEYIESWKTYDNKNKLVLSIKDLHAFNKHQQLKFENHRLSNFKTWLLLYMNIAIIGAYKNGQKFVITADPMYWIRFQNYIRGDFNIFASPYGRYDFDEVSNNFFVLPHPAKEQRALNEETKLCLEKELGRPLAINFDD